MLKTHFKVVKPFQIRRNNCISKDTIIRLTPFKSDTTRRDSVVCFPSVATTLRYNLKKINGCDSIVYVTTKVSFNDMVLKASAMALKKHPQVNTTWQGDTTRFNSHVHMGVAVAVPDGLVVPVVRFADQQSLSQIGAAVKDLAGKARDKKLTPAEMEGSTFTVSNLGMFGIQEFTSIINQPNSAILSVGAIVQKPVVKEGAIVVGNTMKITLACDHRTVDGATAAAFLQTLQAFLENPVTMLA